MGVAAAVDALAYRVHFAVERQHSQRTEHAVSIPGARAAKTVRSAACSAGACGVSGRPRSRASRCATSGTYQESEARSAGCARPARRPRPAWPRRPSTAGRECRHPRPSVEGPRRRRGGSRIVPWRTCSSDSGGSASLALRWPEFAVAGSPDALDAAVRSAGFWPCRNGNLTAHRARRGTQIASTRVSRSDTTNRSTPHHG